MFLSISDGETSSGLTGETRASITPEKRIPKKKKRKNPQIRLHQEKVQFQIRIKTLGTKQYQCLPSDIPPFYSGIKSLRNDANDDNPETTDTSRTDKDDTLHTNQDYSIKM